MVFLAKVLSLFAVIYMVKLFLYPFYRPVSNTQKKRTRKLLNDRKRQAFLLKVQTLRNRLIRKYGRFLLGAGERKRLQRMLDRMEDSHSPEEIRLNQIVYAGGAVIASLVLYKVNPAIGFTTAVLIILGWLYPVDELEKAIETKNKNIAMDFPSFYSMVYYQYSKAVNIYLADVIKDYLPNANRDMAQELGIMLDDCEFGEAFALKHFKKRVPLHYIIKFCDVMETRLNGYNNVSQMTYLKNEIDEFRIRALEQELEKRQAANGRIQLVLIAILGIYISVFYLFTVIDSIKIFQ